MMLSRHELTPLLAAAQGMVAPGIVHSLPFRKLSCGNLSFEGVSGEVLDFKRGMERTFWEAEIPLFAVKLRQRGVCFMLYPRYRDLRWSEWEVISKLGANVALQLGLPVVNIVGDPAWWEVPSRARSISTRARACALDYILF